MIGNQAQLAGVQSASTLPQSRLGEIQVQAGRITDLLHNIGNALSELDGRLTPVLGGEKPQDVSNEMKVPECQTALGSMMQEHVLHLEVLLRYVRSIIGRVEL